MFQLIISAVIAGIIIGFLIVRLTIDTQRSIGPMLCVVFLLIQAAYLLLVLFDNKEGSETWMFLALTYIPLAIFFFILLTFVCLKKSIKIKSKEQHIITCSVLAFHGTGSYLILVLWAEAFNFPL